MTIHTYLKSSRAIDDVLNLLNKHMQEPDSPWNSPNVGRSGQIGIWCICRTGAWSEVRLESYDPAKCAIDKSATLRCYYRPDKSEYIVSDLGDSVTEVMRRTGKAGKSADETMRSLIDGVHIAFGYGAIILRQQDDLPSAILAVIQAVARVRAGLGVG